MLSLALIVALTGAACAPRDGADSGEAPGPDVPAEDTTPPTTEAPPAEVVDPGRMVAEPDVVAAGEATSVRFPRRDGRGPGFVIERRTDDGWVWVWAVYSDPDAAEPRVISAEEFQDGEFAWEAGPGFDDDRPHVIPVPATTPPGRYRVCIAASDPILCAELEVVAAP